MWSLKTSWDEVNESTVGNSFKKCGYSQEESVTEEAQDNAEFQKSTYYMMMTMIMMMMMLKHTREPLT